MHLRKTLSKPKDTLLFINSLLFWSPEHVIFAVAPETKETWNRNTSHNLTATINNRWRETYAPAATPCTRGVHPSGILTHRPTNEDVCSSRSHEGPIYGAPALRRGPREILWATGELKDQSRAVRTPQTWKGGKTVLAWRYSSKYYCAVRSGFSFGGY